MIRLILAEDQGMVRGALAALLELEHDLEVVGQVARGDEIVDAVKEHRPDVALLDIELPGLDGIAAAAEVPSTGAGNARADAHHLRAPRLPAPRDGGRRLGLPRQGRSC